MTLLLLTLDLVYKWSVLRRISNWWYWNRIKSKYCCSGNAVTEITVTDGGTGYNADFTVVTAPGVIGSGSNLVLRSKSFYCS